VPFRRPERSECNGPALGSSNPAAGMQRGAIPVILSEVEESLTILGQRNLEVSRLRST